MFQTFTLTVEGYEDGSWMAELFDAEEPHEAPIATGEGPTPDDAVSSCLRLVTMNGMMQ